MADPPGSKKATTPNEHTLANGKRHSWDKGKHMWLAIYWDDPIRQRGGGQPIVTLKADAGEEASQTKYNVPQVGIPIKKRAGTLENNTGETIRFVLT